MMAVLNFSKKSSAVFFAALLMRRWPSWASFGHHPSSLLHLQTASPAEPSCPLTDYRDLVGARHCLPQVDPAALNPQPERLPARERENEARHRVRGYQVWCCA